MRRILMSIATCLGALGLAGPSMVIAAGTTATPAAAADAGLEAQFMTLLNTDRTTRGLAALATDPSLTSVARSWSDHLLGTGVLSHNSSLTSSLPAGWRRYGENVGYGSGGAASLETAFMNSPEHRANILGDYDRVGIGVDTRADGRIYVTVDFLQDGASPRPAPPAPPLVAEAAVTCASSNPPRGPTAAAALGYYVLGSDGGIFSYAAAPFMGSVPGIGVHAQAVLMALTPDQHGYWVLGQDGGVFSFGDARFFGSVPGIGGHVSGVDLKPSRGGGGYWVLGQDGSVFSFGDAPYLGSLPGVGVRDQAVKLVPTTSGHGYWILGADGGIFSFGDAAFHGSLPGAGVHNTSVSMASTPSGSGYWVLGADGGIFSFGDATFHGSVPGLGCVAAKGVQVVATRTGGGYYVLSNDGRVFPFGDAPAFGQPAGLHVTTLDMAVLHG